MTRTLPRLDVAAAIAAPPSSSSSSRLRWETNAKLADHRPRFRTPPGVVLRLLVGDEINSEPVLVCDACKAPTLHTLRGDHVARCQTCKRDRSW